MQMNRWKVMGILAQPPGLPFPCPSYFCSLGVISATFVLNVSNICFL